MIEVLSAGALATVQDLGRTGTLRWGVGNSGAMDPLALAAGNLLLGNDEDAAGIEVPVFPFQVRFAADCAFAVTGADCMARLDDAPLLPWWTQEAKAGQVLQLGVPRQDGHWRASRAYLCLTGGIDVPEVLGSRSTQLRGAFGGLEGRQLRRGDTLRAMAPGAGQRITGFGLRPPALDLPLQADGLTAVRVLPAAEYGHYTEASRAAFWSEGWKITAQSDRYGYRLAGTALEPVAPIETRDAQPSGGYPKIGTVIEADRWRLGQVPIGSRIRFVETTWDEAIAALDQTRRWLDEAHRLSDLYRGQRARN